MKKQGLKQKSEAIRRAVHEAVERLSRKKIEYNFKDILGIASQYPQNQHPKFQSEDELWEK
ncbi:MAG: hypothetical protein HYT76_10125 [Deltaproteobacteria bacterium]|nr:hypothetical protein [Deltaproteobacteria bacterium]